jgi:pimeloyl-ACP methyl ester carboxylesterase
VSAISVQGPGGRSLEVAVSGPADGMPLVTHHGTPGAAVPYAPTVAAAAERGLRHVTYSRPGYGASDRDEGRSVASCAADVAAILDELGAERCYTYGESGGGPHALACAALLSDRVVKAGTIASIAPWDADGLDWLAGMGEENQQEFTAIQAGPGALRAFLAQARVGLSGLSGDQVSDSLGDLIGEADRAALTGAFADHLAKAITAAVGNGTDGWFDDDMAFVRPWGFDLGAISVPVTIWQGDDDRMVPFAHGEWLAANVRGARSAPRPGEGHLSISETFRGEILDDLLAE